MSTLQETSASALQPGDIVRLGGDLGPVAVVTAVEQIGEGRAVRLSLSVTAWSGETVEVVPSPDSSGGER